MGVHTVIKLMGGNGLLIIYSFITIIQKRTCNKSSSVFKIWNFTPYIKFNSKPFQKKQKHMITIQRTQCYRSEYILDNNKITFATVNLLSNAFQYEYSKHLCFYTSPHFANQTTTGSMDYVFLFHDGLGLLCVIVFHVWYYIKVST